MSLLHRTAIALTLVASACSASTGPDAGAGTPQTKLDALPRALSSSEQNLVSSTNDFSFALFRQLSAARKDSNVFVSPLSASMALGMTLNGAAGPTYDQMKATLGYGAATDADVNASYKSLITLLRGLDPTTDVRIANSIWYRNGFPFTQSFLDAGKTWFDAQISGLDFDNSPAATKTINDWVSTATNGRIPSIIDRIEPQDVMFLINAIYFKGAWRDKFDAAETRDTLFYGASGNQAVRMMHRHGSVSLMSTSDFTAADLPYGNSAYTMTVIVPNQGKSLDAVAASLRTDLWATWVGQFHSVTTSVWLPKLKLEWKRELNDDLKALGMRDAFIPDGADFTRMSSLGKKLYIEKVTQKTFVDINEEGTEAAAVTNVGIGVTSLPPSLRADKPFIFVIRERLSGTVMFMGKIVRIP